MFEFWYPFATGMVHSWADFDFHCCCFFNICFLFLIIGKVSYRVELTLMMWFLMFLIFDFCFLMFGKVSYRADFDDVILNVFNICFWYLIFVKVSYRAELKPKAETAVELLHHSKDKTCRQVHVFFLGQLFSQAFFFSGIFFSSIVLLGRFFAWRGTELFLQLSSSPLKF